jgi:adenylate cyclase class 2
LALEQEIKLPFPTVEAARQAVLSAGGRLVLSRRLVDDQLFDSPDAALRKAGAALRVRRDGPRAALTWKGPAQPGPVKSREELETIVGEADTVAQILSSLGYRATFRSQKYREDYTVDDAAVVIDATPSGVFIEIEASPARIAHVAAALGCTPADYRPESYVSLWRQWCDTHGLPFGDMLFPVGP